ncbi:hypothetical protein [Nocardia veterana]|uniref:Uncharacterized protein n=1 Tax=Nocardia veterana TaxID=132249 RepID=A0A7X6M1K7_9NOCA|nr:hypothetical protein [Nocardia veterana]NKY87657.1 hypothetical protein [Nocardia veterana]
MAYSTEPELIVGGRGEIGVAQAGSGCAVRFGSSWAWLCWPDLDATMVSRLAAPPIRLVSRPGFGFDLAESEADDRVHDLLMPGYWQRVRVEGPVRIFTVPAIGPVAVAPGPLALVVDDDDRAESVVDRYVDAIRAGRRPVVLAVAAVRGGVDDTVAFVVDGHHALAAYRRLDRWPPVDLLICDDIQCWHPEHRAGQPDCCAESWIECWRGDPLTFGMEDLTAAFAHHPRAARAARPLFASFGDIRTGRPGHIVDVVDGRGLIRIEGSRDRPAASVLWLNGRPALADALLADGSLAHLVARLAPEQRPAGLDELARWLAAPVVARDYAGHPVLSREFVDKLDPLLHLFAPGRYAISIATATLSLCPSRYGFQPPDASGWAVEQAPGTWVAIPCDYRGHHLHATRDSAELDPARIDWYIERIAAGAEPVAIVVSAGSAEPGIDSQRARFLLDGHHKVTAGASVYLEISPCDGDGFADTVEFSRRVDPYLRDMPYYGRWSRSDGYRSSPPLYRSYPRLLTMYPTSERADDPPTPIEYLCRYGVRYGNPAAPDDYHTATTRLLAALGGRLGEQALRRLTDIDRMTHPAHFESVLLESLEGLSLSPAEVNDVADVVADLDDERLAALIERSR